MATRAPQASQYEEGVLTVAAWPPAVWEVWGWRDWYRRWVPANTPALPSEPELIIDRGLSAETLWWTGEMETFRAREANLHALRTAIGKAQGWGYEAGREGRERAEVPYSDRRWEAFAWLSGWETGNYDYEWKARRVINLRSPGVTWPVGHPNHTPKPGLDS